MGLDAVAIERFPTICGTGTEDYFCGSYNFENRETKQYQEFCTPYAGLCQVIRPNGVYESQQRFGLYRWHLVDPIRFSSDLKVTIQALSWRSGGRYLPLQDDIASVAFWYQTLPTWPCPPPTVGVQDFATMSANKITIDEVRHVAKLARLELDESELAGLTRQLEPILGYVAKISQLNVDNVEPMAHALPLHNVLREDVIEPALPLDKVLQNAPEVDGAFFSVPKILGGDEDSAG